MMVEPRIHLIPVTEEHLDLICKEESDASQWKYEEYVEQDEKAIRHKFREQFHCNYRYNFAVMNSADEVVGFCYIWIAQESRKSWEIGYVILPQYMGRGFAAESLKQLIRFGFQELHAHKVIGMCNSQNIASAKVMEKCDMKRQGVFRQEYLCQGEWVDQYYYSILSDEYRD